MGTTNCVPLWNKEHTKFYGSYCQDVIPASESSSFIEKYFDTVPNHIVDYLIFNPKEGELGSYDRDTQMWTYMQDLVFNSNSDEQHYSIQSINIESVRIDTLNKYIERAA